MQEQFFPSVEVIRLNVDLGVHEIAYLAPDTDLNKAGFIADKLNDVIDVLRKNSMANPRQPHLRVRYHQRYQMDLQEDRPGQMWARWNVGFWGPSMMVEKESYEVVALAKMEDDFKDWLWNATVSI